MFTDFPTQSKHKTQSGWADHSWQRKCSIFIFWTAEKKDANFLFSQNTHKSPTTPKKSWTPWKRKNAPLLQGLNAHLGLGGGEHFYLPIPMRSSNCTSPPQSWLSSSPMQLCIGHEDMDKNSPELGHRTLLAVEVVEGHLALKEKVNRDNVYFYFLNPAK